MVTSEDAALQMQMVTGTRGGPLGLIFWGSLWRDPEETCMIVVETLHRRLLRNRRVSRRAKAGFFSVGTIEHLRKVSFFCVSFGVVFSGPIFPREDCATLDPAVGESELFGRARVREVQSRFDASCDESIFVGPLPPAAITTTVITPTTSASAITSTTITAVTATAVA